MSSKKTPQTLKGFRDFLPEEAIKRQSVIDRLRAVFELYGFNPLETPALEYAEILEGKYGDEGEKLIYKFKDRGGRDVAMRYDQTVPLARVIAQYGNELPMPFKRYQIQPVWRAEKPQAGRFREFLQCDIDTIGSSSPLTEAEIFSCILACMEQLGFKDYKLLVNDRQYLDSLLKKYNMETISVYRALDKLPVDYDGLPGREITKTFRSKTNGSVEKSKKMIQELMTLEEPESIAKIKKLVERMGNDASRIEYSRPLTRGMDYYTEIVFELIAKVYKNLSVGGGGRYDNLIGMFAGKQIPAVGFAFGFDRLVEAMEQQGLLDLPKTVTKVLVTIFSPELQTNSIEATTKLRAAGVNTELYPDPETKLDKQLKYADRKGIPYVIIIGPEEVKNITVTVKNMSSGEQKNYPLDKIPKM